MLNREQIKHVADLARLSLTEEEINTYSRELSAVIDYIESLSEVNVNQVEPTAQVSGQFNNWRADEIYDWPEDEKRLCLEAAKINKDNLIEVMNVSNK